MGWRAWKTHGDERALRQAVIRVSQYMEHTDLGNGNTSRTTYLEAELGDWTLGQPLPSRSILTVGQLSQDGTLNDWHTLDLDVEEQSISGNWDTRFHHNPIALVAIERFLKKEPKFFRIDDNPIIGSKIGLFSEDGLGKFRNMSIEPMKK